MSIKAVFSLFVVVLLAGCQENIKHNEQAPKVSESKSRVVKEHKVALEQHKKATATHKPRSAYDTLTAKLVWQGEQALMHDRLLTPVDDNANLYFQAALGRDPGNYRATVGIRKIVDTYTQWAWQAAVQGHYAKADKFLSSARSVNPQDSEIDSIKDRIDGLKKRRQEAASSTGISQSSAEPSSNKTPNIQRKTEKIAKEGQYFLPKNLFSLSDDEILAKIQPIIDKVAADKSEMTIYWPNDKQARLLYRIINSRVSEFRVRAMIYHRDDYLVELQKPQN